MDKSQREYNKRKKKKKKEKEKGKKEGRPKKQNFELQDYMGLIRPFLSSSLPPLQGESKCEVFLMKISFH